MSWRSRLTDDIGERLRFIGYAFLILDGVVLSLFTLWLTAKFLWFLGCWLDRVMFSSPW